MENTGTGTNTSLLRFASNIVGNLGAPLDFDIDPSPGPVHELHQTSADPLAAGILSSDQDSSLGYL